MLLSTARERSEKASPVRFSLIVATLGRTEEIERLLASLVAQTYKDFDLIVVDQNGDDRLEPFLAPYRHEYPVLRLTSEPGLSRARNVGLEHARGDVIAFPDDDCWYPPDLLERIAGSLNNRDGIAGCSVFVREDGERLVSGKVGMPRFDREAGLLNKTNAWARAISYTIFLRRGVVEKVGRFDESLGIGAPWGSGEDTDYPLRAVKAGFELYYDPGIAVYHRALPEQSELAERAYRYGVGMGRVWRKHDYPLWFVVYYLLRPAGGALLSLAKGRGSEVRYYFNSLRGRLRGWRSG